MMKVGIMGRESVRLFRHQVISMDKVKAIQADLGRRASSKQ